MRKSPQNNRLSKKIEAVNYSAIRAAFAAGRNPDVINATIGAPDFDVPPAIKKAAKEAIDAGHNGYTETKGVLPLRRAISEYLARRARVQRSADEVVVTAGTTMAIYLALLSLLDDGDEVVIFEPYFVAYPEIVRLLGGVPVFASSDSDFQPNTEDLERVVSEKTRAIIVNSPNNPTGAVYTREKIEEIVRIAEKNDVYLLSDEIYRELAYEGEVFSPAAIYEKTILIDGLSKSSGMTGWRVGYIAGPKDIIDAVEKAQQFTSVCAPSAFQHAAAAALRLPMDQSIITRYRETRDVLFDALKDFGAIVKPTGAFYFFFQMPINGEKAAAELLERGVAVVPGGVFGSRYKKYVRVSYAMPLIQAKKMVAQLREYVSHHQR